MFYNNSAIISTQIQPKKKPNPIYPWKNTSSWHIVRIFCNTGIMWPLHFQKNLPEWLQCHLNVTCQCDPCFVIKKKKKECTECSPLEHLLHCRHELQCDPCASARNDFYEMRFTGRQRLHGSHQAHAIKLGFQIINAVSKKSEQNKTLIN